MSFLKTVRNDLEFLQDCQMNGKCEDDQSEQIATCSEITEMTKDIILKKEKRNMMELTISEHKLSFRVQESETIRRYSKSIYRKPDYKKKMKREERAEKKRKKELKRKLKRLKALKKKEIEKNLQKLKEVCVQKDLNLDGDDIEGDFDSEEHDRKMNRVFNEEYYAVRERKKPKFPYNEELDAENWDKWTRNRSGDHKRKMKREEYAQKRMKKLKHKIRRLEALEKKFIQEKRLELEEDCEQDELIIDNVESDERTKGSSNGVEVQRPKLPHNRELGAEYSRIREGEGSTLSKENDIDYKHKVDSERESDEKDDAKWQFEQDILGASHSSKMRRKKSSVRRKKKRSFDDSLKENCFLDCHCSHHPTKIRKREEIYNCSYKSSSFCESNIPSKHTEESVNGADISRTKHKKKKRSKVKQDLFHTKSSSGKESCSKTIDLSPNFKAELKTVKDLFYNLSL